MRVQVPHSVREVGTREERAGEEQPLRGSGPVVKMGRGKGADLLGHKAEGCQGVKTTPFLVAALALIRAVAV